jgi:D-glycero-D-manno-heptose 1,7-bisphosphate phosphatase
MTKASHSAVFLDRDGTLMQDVDYCGDPNDVHVFEGATEALRRLNQAGYKLVVITNQSGIGRGYFSEQQYESVEQELTRQLGEGLIAATYYCPHLPTDRCECRKPSANMVVRAARDLDLDLSKSFFVGDKRTDIECGQNAGVKTILVRTGYGQKTDPNLADFVARQSF